MSNRRQNQRNFLDHYLRGEALAEDIDDYVDSWHASSGKRPLHESLGMSKEEYEIWCQDPDILPYIALARREDISIQEVLRKKVEAWKIAAHSSDAAKVSRLRRWLATQD